MENAVLTHDLSLDQMAKNLDLSRRAVQVLMLMVQYGELTTGEISDSLGITMKTLRTRHLPKLVDLHWLRAERLVQSGPGTEKWRMDAVRRKRVEVLYRTAERTVQAKLGRLKRAPIAKLNSAPVKLGSMN